MWVKRGWGTGEKGIYFMGTGHFLGERGNKDNIGEQPSRHILLTFFSPQFILQFYRGARGCPMVISKKTLIFQGSARGGPTFFRR